MFGRAAFNALPFIIHINSVNAWLEAGRINPWVTARNAGGGVLSIKASVVSGFIRGGRFYTRAEAAALVARIGRGHRPLNP